MTSEGAKRGGVSLERAVFDDEDLSVLRQLVTSDCETSYVSGSRVEGFGNPYSDVDFFLVTRARVSVLQQPAIQGDHYVDCEYHSWDDLLELSETFRQIHPEDCTDRWPTDQELDLYYRTAIGLPVIGAERFLELQSHFPKEIFPSIYSAVASARAETLLWDAKGSIGCRDELRSLLAARSAAEWATEAMLAQHGEAYPNLKWRCVKAARRFGRSSKMYHDVWAIQNIGSRTLQEYLDATGAWCSKWAVLASVLQVPSPTSFNLATGVEETVVGEGVVVTNSDGRAYTLNSLQRALWDEVKGGTTALQSAAVVARHTDLTSDAARLVADRFLERLSACQLANAVREEGNAGGDGAL